jgi:hypothetical protein
VQETHQQVKVSGIDVIKAVYTKAAANPVNFFIYIEFCSKIISIITSIIFITISRNIIVKIKYNRGKKGPNLLIAMKKIWKKSFHIR